MNVVSFAGGIEYIVPSIRKAYPQVWAEEFLNQGVMYFTNDNIFRHTEHPQRGDNSEGEGVYNRQGVRCTSSAINPVFLWCATMETCRERILRTWQDRDTIVEVQDVLALIGKVRSAIRERTDLINSVTGFALGPVTYDKDTGGHTPYCFYEGVFQKHERYNEQKEFRLVLVGQNRLVQDEYGMDCLKADNDIRLQVGNCRDIVHIFPK